jgi:hypothetical protein
MSEHASSHDAGDDHQSADSKSLHIFNIVSLVALIGVVIILSMVGGTSQQGHVWPADNSAKVPLTSTNPAKS